MDEKFKKNDGVVMNSEGKLRARMISHSNSGTDKMEMKEEMALERKKMVMGLEEYEQHSLEDANRKINSIIKNRDSRFETFLKHFLPFN